MPSFFITFLSGIIALLCGAALYGWAYYLALPPILLRLIMYGGGVGVVLVMVVEAIATRRIGAGGYMTAFYIGFILLLAMVLFNAKIGLSTWKWLITYAFFA